uniref:AarF domain-containing protein kinase 2 n=1 Tax=Ascaris suum TaxID=6253 RepID=F1L0G0_ASCSU
MLRVVPLGRWTLKNSNPLNSSHHSTVLVSRCSSQFKRTDCPKRLIRCTRIVFGSGLLISSALARVARCEHVTNEDAVMKSLRSPWLISSEIGAERGVEEIERSRNIFIRFFVCIFGTTLWLLKLTVRITTLSVRFAPLGLTCPLVLCSDRIRRLWWSFALWTIQKSGPTLVKLGQWASTRRDIFSKDFCDKMAVLHTKTTHRSWGRASRSALDALFPGIDWSSFIVAIQSDPIGSGCIAQVYKAKVDLDKFYAATGIKFAHPEGKKILDVAIKVAERGVRESIEIDLSILRCCTRLAEMIAPSLLFVNPISCLDQFETVLKRQVDLRNEANALKRFSRNFDVDKTGIRFPLVLCFSKDVIIETFEEGMYVNRLVTGDHEILAHQAASVKRRVALMGARALLKMIFVDNFVHGDLHPGNILIRFNDRHNGLNDVHRAPETGSLFLKMVDSVKETVGWVHEPRIRFTENLEYNDEPTLVILDTGIAVEETPDNLKNLRALFRAVVEKRGYDVGQLLLDHAPQHRCKDPEQFCSEIENVVRIARSKGSLRTLNISEMLNELFSIVSRHQVSLETSFTTVVIAVMVLEGFGRSLDPDLDLFQCARPYLLSVIH